MIECISISVYDTQLPAVSNQHIEDFALRDSIKLIYEGSDDKFTVLMASVLEFSLEIPDEDSLQSLLYDHLFTGDENRYLVEITDQDDGVLWRGFILPDEYQEPYTTGTFYVNFTAADGLGLLKGRELPSGFYRGKNSMISAVAKALLQTGLELEIWVAPAFENAGADGLWENLYVDGRPFESSGDRESAYDILEQLLEQMGCRIFQRFGRWYIEGVNRAAEPSINYRRYDKDGVYMADAAPGFLQQYNDWNTGANLGLKPPFKTVELTTGIETTAQLLPEDVVEQPWIKQQEPQIAPPVIYWSSAHVDITALLYSNAQGGTIPTYTSEDLKIPGFVGFECENALVEPAVYNYYLSLRRKPFINRDSGSLTIKGVFIYKRYNNNEVPIYYELNDRFFYEVLIDGVAIVSNRLDFSGRESYYYSFDENIIDGWSYLTCRLDITLEDFSGNGYLDFRIFNPKNATDFSDIVWMESLQIAFVRPLEDSYIKTRALSRSNKHTGSLYGGDSSLDLVQKAFIYQPAIDPSELTQVFFNVAQINAGDQIINNAISVGATEFALIATNIDRVYIRRIGTDFYQYIDDITDNGSTTYYLLNLYGEAPMDLSDELYVRPATGGNPQTTAIRNNREQWKKAVGDTTQRRFGETLARVYHDVYPETLVVMEGETMGLIFPGDAFLQEIKGSLRRFMVARSEITPGRNHTQLVAIEAKVEDVTDYE